MTKTEAACSPVNDQSRSRWAGVGESVIEDSYSAGVEAVAGALSGDDVALLIVFCGHRHDYQRLVAGIQSVAGGEPQIVGCTTGGEIALGGVRDGSVVIMAIGGSGITVAAQTADRRTDDLRSAGEFVAGAVDEVEDLGHTVLMLLSDGLAGDQQEVVRGAYARVGARVPLVGGCAGDGLEMSKTTLFATKPDGTCVTGIPVLGVAISSIAPMGIGVEHGWEPVGEPVLITSSQGNTVYTIDEQPALDRYLQLHGAPPDLAHDQEAFTRFAATHPLGVVRRSGNEVRFIFAADSELRTITSIAAVPNGSMAWAMRGTADSILQATDAACTAAIEQLDGPPVGLIAFDCVARRGQLNQDQIYAGLDSLQKKVGAPIAGFYTYGEFARVKGASGFHNQTLVTLAFG